MKRSFIVAALGSTGDVNPMLGIALELLHRGHDVTLIANAVFEPSARAGGVKFVPVGTERDYRFVWDPDSWRWWRIAVAFKKGWLPCLRPTYESIASQSRTAGTVLVANSVAAGAQFAQEKFSLPLVLVTPTRIVFECLDDFPNYGPFQGAPRWLGRPARRLHRRLTDIFIDRWIGDGVNALRSEIGLPSRRRFFSRWMESAERVVGLWPEWFARPQTSWPRQLVLAGFLNYDRDDLESFDEVSAFINSGTDRPIIFTCGSAMTHAQGFLDLAVGVQRILGRPAVVVTDRTIQPSSPLPPGIVYSPYVPFRRLLPRAAAIVHHGGAGTCSAALAAGIPQLIAPLAYDQFDNAERCENLGVARRVPRYLLTPRRVARRLCSLLGSPAVAQRCRDLARLMDSGEALRRACEAIETLPEGQRT